MTAALDFDWSPSRWIRRNLTADEVVLNHQSVMLQGSEIARRDLFCQANICYGFTAKNKFDLYTSSQKVSPGCPMVVYIHGGYWQFLSKEESAFLAPPLSVARPDGVVFIAVDYVLATEREYEEKASMSGIYNEMRQLLRALTSLARSLFCSGIHLIGHSAGAHLATGMLSLEYPSDERHHLFQLIKSVWLMGGIYDLEAISHTYVNDPLQLTSAEIEDCSPVRHAKTCALNMENTSNAVIQIVYGEFEPPVFHQESVRYFQALKAELYRASSTVTLLEPVMVRGRDHFNVIDCLHDNYILQRLSVLLSQDQREPDEESAPTPEYIGPKDIRPLEPADQQPSANLYGDQRS